MNTYETKWLRVQFPDPWRIQTTRDKIVFTPLSRTSADVFELACVKKEVGEETDQGLDSFAASFDARCTKRDSLHLGNLQGFCLTLQDREKRLFLRSGKYMVMGTIRSDDTDFQTQALSIIKAMELIQD
jgi:hypothetical protein